VIDCPICHVKNHDDARFCAECGQRLGGSGQSVPPQSPTAQGQPPLVGADANRPQAPRLHSPLLSGAGMESVPHDPTDAGEVNRLRQLSSRSKEDPQINQTETPYKNPYDPRNAQAQQSGQNSPAEPPKHKLRSPLLSGEEFPDEDESWQQPDNPVLGNSHSGLRSPLLGGGSGSFSGQDRRTPQPTLEEFSGNERRRPLHSPLLHNTDEVQRFGGNSAGWEDDEPIEEDNPNVLRSPLLAAKRPLSDRPASPLPADTGASARPNRPGQPPESVQLNVNRPAPNNAPAQAAPSSAPPANSAMLGSRPNSTQEQYQFGLNQAPQAVPVAFQNMQSGQLPQAPAAASFPPGGTTGNISPPLPAATPPKPSAPPASASMQEPQRKPTSRLLAGSYDDTDEQHYSGSPANDRFAPASGPPSPLPKMIGVLAGLLLIGKLYVIVTFFQTQWRDSIFLVVDQFIGAGLIVCLMVLAFNLKSR
jgi:hypothetical protein